MDEVDTIRERRNKPYVVAISGVKNSGKTTFIQGLIPMLKESGYKVGTIKHDGHEFECDVEGTDSYKHRASGADGIAIFSSTKYMMIEQKENMTEEILLEQFKGYDVVLLEGFKYSNHPKIELIRKGNSKESVCDKDTILAVATNIEDYEWNGIQFHIDDIESAAKIVKEQMGGDKRAR